MSSSSSNDASLANDTRVPVGIMAGIWAFLLGIIGAILLSISYYSKSPSAEQTWSAGLYVLGGAAILALFVYIDAVSLDRGEREPVKKD